MRDHGLSCSARLLVLGLLALVVLGWSRPAREHRQALRLPQENAELDRAPDGTPLEHYAG